MDKDEAQLRRMRVQFERGKQMRLEGVLAQLKRSRDALIYLDPFHHGQRFRSPIAPQLLKKINSAIKSCEGALRHSRNLEMRNL
jgi:hypothetical protein